MGAEINSTQFDEICPVISDDGDILYFTRVGAPDFNRTLMQFNRDQSGQLNAFDYNSLLSNIYSEIAGRKIIAPIDSEFNQDIWIAYFLPDSTIDVQHPGYPINNALPNSVCSLFPEENALILVNQFNQFGGMKEGFSILRMKGFGIDGFPEPLNIYDFKEEGAGVNLSMSRDSEHLFLSLQRNDSRGGYDLYVSIRVNDNLWSRPFQIQTGVNTEFNESTPFISKDKKRLYFASNRAGLKGGYDIYMCRRLDYTYMNWSEPEKLSTPINTSFDESQPFLDLKEEYMYFTSNRDGTSDIFRVSLKPVETLSEPITLNLRIFDSKTNKLTRAELRWGDAKRDVLNKFFRTYTGEHTITIEKDEPIRIEARKRGYKSEEIFINPRELLNKNITIHDVDIFVHKGVKKIDRKPLPLFGKKRKIVLRQIFFERSSDVVQDKSIPQLEALYEVLRINPNMGISIEGHTDNVGDKNDLMELSLKRAQAIKSYLTDLKIAPERISIIGYGDTKPLNKNRNEAEREKNRRVEVRIIKQ